MNIIVTGGAGFIGANLVHYIIEKTAHTVCNVDKLTYAGNLNSIKNLQGNPRYSFEQTDICDFEAMRTLFNTFRPDAILHLAAESHVDRSIDGSRVFIETNVIGTHTLLEAARGYYSKLSDAGKAHFRFLHVSTDEVYGTLGKDGYFTENSRYTPNSPYSASKAGSDHLVRAWYHTYRLPTIITNCSNNYGPYQFPEKLIPVIILNALAGKNIPVYGRGENVRDWLFVTDHVRAVLHVLQKGTPGETYLIGGHNEKNNITIVEKICNLLDEIVPKAGSASYKSLITFVTDRPGHDFRYAIDPAKLEKELGWHAETSFEDGIRTTVQWYLDNKEWCANILNGGYRLKRLGLGEKS